MAKYRARGRKSAGKRIVYITPYYDAAKEAAVKYEKKGYATTVEKEFDEANRLMYVVYVL